MDICLFIWWLKIVHYNIEFFLVSEWLASATEELRNDIFGELDPSLQDVGCLFGLNLSLSLFLLFFIMLLFSLCFLVSKFLCLSLLSLGLCINLFGTNSYWYVNLLRSNWLWSGNCLLNLRQNWFAHCIFLLFVMLLLLDNILDNVCRLLLHLISFSLILLYVFLNILFFSLLNHLLLFFLIFLELFSFLWVSHRVGWYLLLNLLYFLFYNMLWFLHFDFLLLLLRLHIFMLVSFVFSQSFSIFGLLLLFLGGIDTWWEEWVNVDNVFQETPLIFNSLLLFWSFTFFKCWKDALLLGLSQVEETVQLRIHLDHILLIERWLWLLSLSLVNRLDDLNAYNQT